MYRYHYTKQSHLDRILHGGLPASDRLTDADHNPAVTWLAENANPSTQSRAGREFADHIHPGPGIRPPGYSWNLPDFARDGDIRVKVRIRKEQQFPWLWWTAYCSGVMYGNIAALSEFNDGWNIATKDVKPNQIVSVYKWSVQTGEWVKLELSRRLVLPAEVRHPRLFPRTRARLRSRVYSRTGHSIDPVTHPQNGI